MVEKNRHRSTAHDAEGIGHDGEQQEHGDAGEDARGDELAHRVDTKGAHGVNLLGDNHRSQFAGHGGCVSAGNHDAREHCAQLANHGQADELARDRGCAELR